MATFSAIQSAPGFLKVCRPMKAYEAKKKPIPPSIHLDSIVHVARGERVILDTDLARLDGIPTFRLSEAVKRNRDRFPEDFLFQLTEEELPPLTSQTAISKKGRGGRRTLPYAFTEHGAVMAANESAMVEEGSVYHIANRTCMNNKNHHCCG